MAAQNSKPVEIEGFFDLRFYTPLGGIVARGLSHSAVTPNQVSWASVAVAAVAAGTYLVPTLGGALAASALFIASGVLDSADGQLARLTGRTSELGETLDGFCDTLSFTLVYLAAGYLAVTQQHCPVWLVVCLCLLAGWSHAVQSSLVDFERQVFVHIITGRGRVAREEPADLLAAQQRARAAGEGWFAQMLRSARLSYCRRQRRLLASTTRLLTTFLRASPEERRAFTPRYREAMRPVLKPWAVLAPNSHTLGVLVAGLAPYLFPGVPLARWGLALVFLYDNALNVPMALLILAQRGVDGRLMRALAGGGARMAAPALKAAP